MYSIYCIEDINDLKYVGSTKQKLCVRLAGHRVDNVRSINRNKKCSSSKLNLYNCIIYELDTCSVDERRDKERYWINKIDCVNHHKLNGRDKDKQKQYMKQYYKDRKINNLNE